MENFLEMVGLLEHYDDSDYDVVKEIEKRSLKIGFFDADSERATNIIKKIK